MDMLINSQNQLVLNTRKVQPSSETRERKKQQKKPHRFCRIKITRHEPAAFHLNSHTQGYLADEFTS